MIGMINIMNNAKRCTSRKKRIRKCSIVAIIAFFLAICLKLNSRSMRGYRIDPFFSAPTPPGREEFWKRTEESSCFNIDSVCNWKGGWFYKPIRGDIVTQYQPGVQYLGKLTYRYHGEREIRVDEGIQVSVSSNSHGLYDDKACSLSSTPIHLVAQSPYNEMMCEFYLRTILGLNRWMRDYPQRSSDDMQIYVHFIENNDLFEGHRLFLSGLPNNNKFESFATLMPRDDTCRCYRKLVFCGYQVENASSVKYNASHAFLGSDFDQDFKDKIRSEIDAEDKNALVFKPLMSVLNPKTDDYYCEGDCDVRHDYRYRDLRSDLINTHWERFQDLDGKILHYKREILIELGIIGINSSNIDGWKFVGFTRRKSRRLWLNFDDAMSMCNEKFRRHMVVCIIVDVEDAESPEKQLVMHRSLHALIGVHGSQLTQGILLPPHGSMLELLPWIPRLGSGNDEYTWGSWTASTDYPTPIGIIYHNTEINHYGFALGRESVPLCLHLMEESEMLEDCLTNDENLAKFNWDVRDFTVPIKVIEEFVSKILLNDGNATTCEEMKNASEESNFVLFNAYCRRGANQSKFATEHYYRSQGTNENR